MNHHQKLVQKQFLNDEEKIIKRLKSVYNQSLKDINGKVAELDTSISTLQKVYNSVGDDEIGDLAAAFLKSNQIMTPEEAKETLQSMIQSKVYQKKYQEALKKQVGGVLDTMQAKEFKAVSEYLTECYENGFVGAMYDLQGQGIPLCFPMDQEAMVRAVQLDSKISEGLYQRLGEDVDLLKKKITAQVSRGISSGLTFKWVAQELAGTTNIGFNNAVRIARTEGHRIQCQAGMDACYKAKEKGADVVKQWDAALDSRTRESHAMVDGEIRELDEKFSNGLMFPSDPSGGAAEVINCRCALLQRARWALEGEFTKINNFTKQIETFESPKDYAEFKKAFFSKENKKYMDYVATMEEKYDTKDFRKVLDKMSDKEFEKYTKLTNNNPVFNRKALTNSMKSGKISSGAITGAYNNKNDPEGIMRKAHAEKYYSSMRNSEKNPIVSAIAKNANIDDKSVSKMYDHLLINKYNLDKGLANFDEDYDIAESLRRLREGKDIQAHDLLLVKHEALEYDLMNIDGLSYEEAHAIANKSFDYQAALEKWLDKIEG